MPADAFFVWSRPSAPENTSIRRSPGFSAGTEIYGSAGSSARSAGAALPRRGAQREHPGAWSDSPPVAEFIFHTGPDTVLCRRRTWPDCLLTRQFNHRGEDADTSPYPRDLFRPCCPESFRAYFEPAHIHPSTFMALILPRLFRQDKSDTNFGRSQAPVQGPAESALVARRWGWRALLPSSREGLTSPVVSPVPFRFLISIAPSPAWFNPSALYSP